MGKSQIICSWKCKLILMIFISSLIASLIFVDLKASQISDDDSIPTVLDYWLKTTDIPLSFQMGINLYRQGEYYDAINEFEIAYNMKKNQDLQDDCLYFIYKLNLLLDRIPQAYEKLNQLINEYPLADMTIKAKSEINLFFKKIPLKKSLKTYH